MKYNPKQGHFRLLTKPFRLFVDFRERPVSHRITSRETDIAAPSPADLRPVCSFTFSAVLRSWSYVYHRQECLCHIALPPVRQTLLRPRFISFPDALRLFPFGGAQKHLRAPVSAVELQTSVL